MKIISLIPLTAGTGMCHFISSLAKIEMDNVLILDLDNNSILTEMLKAERDCFHGNNPGINETEEYHLEVHTTCFYNKLIRRTTQFTEVFEDGQFENLVEFIINRYEIENENYLSTLSKQS